VEHDGSPRRACCIADANSKMRGSRALGVPLCAISHPRPNEKSVRARDDELLLVERTRLARASRVMRIDASPDR